MRNAIMTVILYMLTNCACTTLHSLSEYEKWMNELETSEIEFLREQADYFRNEYRWTTRDEALWAYSGIVNGYRLKLLYSNVKPKQVGVIQVDSTQAKSSNNILTLMTHMKDVLILHSSHYSETWSNAIRRHTQNEYLCIDFSSALGIEKKRVC